MTIQTAKKLSKLVADGQLTSADVRDMFADYTPLPADDHEDDRELVPA